MAEIEPRILPPIFPYGQEAFGKWLFQGIGFDPETGQWNFQPTAQYPGQQIADPGATRLQDVWQQWNPEGGSGMTWLQDWYLNNRGGVGQYSPLSQQLMDWGGTDSPGTRGMHSLMDWGVASPESGIGVQRMMGSGMASPESGFNLSQFASGDFGTGAAATLAPFLTGQAHGMIPQGPAYTPPNIVSRPIQRRG